jgi:integrase/recombinase XerD
VKINRHGQAKILTPEEIQLLFTKGLTNQRDRTLFAICLFTACRIQEAVTLITGDIYTPAGVCREEIIIRKSNTKGKLQTRQIPVIDDLRLILTAYYPLTGETYLFPGRHQGRLHHDTAGRILKKALKQIGIEGASTHSFRRTALTQMSNARIPLRVIQEISGHRNLEQLQRYLEVQPNQVKGAIATLSMLAPTETTNQLDLIKYDNQAKKNNITKNPIKKS